MEYTIEPPGNEGIKPRNIIAEDGSVVATVNHYKDAQLIAKAPRMHEALREITELAPRDKLKLPYAIRVVEIAEKALAEMIEVFEK